MEIKVGDKVRVSKDAPRIFFGKCDMSQIEFTVGVVDKDVAEICIVNDEKTQMKAWIIPCKYLVKVEDEAKESKFKKGDRVKFKNIYELQKVKAASFHWMLTMFASKEATITAVEDNGFYRVDIDPSIGGINDDMIESKVEPTAPTIKIGDRVCCYNVLHLKGSKKEDYMGIVTSITDMGIMVQLDNGGAMLSYRESDLELVQPKEQKEAEKKTNVGSIKIPVEVDITDSYWDAYTADLAKEIAVKVANKYNGPKEAADYAVSVAKAVVENLKKK